MKLKPDDNPCRAEEQNEPGISTELKFVRDKRVVAHDVQLIRADDGGSKRTFNGRRAHENGWYVSRKAGRLLHWEGTAQFDFLTRAEVEFGVASMTSEAVEFQFVRDGKKQSYTIDVELVAPDGRLTFIEIKRDENDLKDPEYRAKLGYVREICEERGIRFRIIFRHQIWESLIHRRNVNLFSARRFVSVRPEHIERLEKHARAVGDEATFGSLSDALDPTRRLMGEAVLQALTVARRVQIDLTRPILDATRITIH